MNRVAAVYTHLRLPAVLAASLLAGAAGEEWLTRWPSTSQPSSSQQTSSTNLIPVGDELAAHDPHAPSILAGSLEPSTAGGDLATSRLP